MKFAETAILQANNMHLDHTNVLNKSVSSQSIKSKIEEKAKEFESVFIAESLKHANIGMPKDPEIGGSLITDTFDSFMNRALADSIMEQGGFGLAKHITESLIHSYQKP